MRKSAPSTSGATPRSKRPAVAPRAVLRLGAELTEALEARELTDLYERFERPLIRVLAKMEESGIRIDRKFLDELRAQLATECDDLVRRIHAHAGKEFNVNSTPQLRTILFDELGLTPQKKTKTGPSTDADSLQKMIDDHPIVADLLRYREVEKLRGTYADALPPLIDADGRVRATLKQTDTTTGRISSEAPNLQNVPVRTADGREFRRAFIADDGWGILTADYSQIELRVLAHLAEDPGLLDAFSRGVDIHTVTAAKVFGVKEAEVDDAQRRFAKVVNYGLAYGMEAYGLGTRLDIPTEDAREILDNYFAGFPKVKAFMQDTVVEAKQRGYTTTIFGRRRQITELASDNFRIRQMGERMAQNAPVQGSAADIFKLAMIDVDRALDDAGLETRMLLTVHDELVFEVPLDRTRSRGAARAHDDGVRLRVAASRSRSTSASDRTGPSRSESRVTEPGWFNPVADFLGTAYLRNAFTKGTEQEVDFLVDALGLDPGTRILDVGCGPGRHSLALARRGFAVLGVDLSDVFIRLAQDAATRGRALGTIRGAGRAPAGHGRGVRCRDLPVPGRFRAAGRPRRGGRLRPDRARRPAGRSHRGLGLPRGLRRAAPGSRRTIRSGDWRDARSGHCAQ